MSLIASGRLSVGRDPGQRVLDPKEETMGAILELTSYAATPFGMVAIIVIAALAYFAARWVFSD
ncbi:hypothetical protein DSM21852_00010 [Methylocystis bryophila]|nr:hypothetical protein DSM21852_00010 [Methylocystis bryophila]